MDVNESALSAAGEKGYVSLSRCDLPDKVPFGGTRVDLIVLFYFGNSSAAPLTDASGA